MDLDPVVIAAIIQAGIVLTVGLWIEWYRHRKERRVRLESLRRRIYDEFAELSIVCTNALGELLSADSMIKRFAMEEALDRDFKINLYNKKQEKSRELGQHIDLLKILSKKAEITFKSNLVYTSIKQFAAEISYIQPEWVDEDLSEDEILDRFQQDASAIFDRLRPISETIQTLMITELKDLA